MGETMGSISSLGNSAPCQGQMEPPQRKTLQNFFSSHFKITTDFDILRSKVLHNVFWGHPLTDPSPMTLRVVFQNSNAFHRDHFERFNYLNQLASLQPTFVCLSETNINWSNQHPIRSSISRSIQTRWPRHRFTTAHTPNAVPNSCVSQGAGGTLQFVI